MANRKKWNPIRLVPRGKLVTLKTVRGIECQGIVPKKSKIRKPDNRVSVERINAYRTDLGANKIGDIRAVGWR